MVFIVLLACVVAGCKSQASVLIDVAERGNGTITVEVRLDQAAAAAVGDLNKQLRVADLRDSGWVVKIEQSRDGGATLRASHEFGSPKELQAVLDRVGSGGLLTEWSLDLEHGFFGTDYSIKGELHLRGPLDQFSDSEVATLLDGLALGRTEQELNVALEANPEAFTLQVRVALPGEIQQSEGFAGQGRAGAGESDPQASRAGLASTPAILGSGPVDQRLSASSTRADRVPMLLVGLGVILCGAMVALLGLSVRTKRSRSAATARTARRASVQ